MGFWYGHSLGHLIVGCRRRGSHRAVCYNSGSLAAAVLPNLYFSTRKIIINEVLLSKFQTHTDFFTCLAKVDLIWLSRVQKSVSLEVGQTINFMAGTTEHSKPFHKARQLNLIKQLFWQVAESGKSAIRNVSRHKFDECMNVSMQVKMCCGRVWWQPAVQRVEGVPPESFVHMSHNSFLEF